MEEILHKGFEISKIPILNRPSYMKQNSYGNVSFIPVVTPLDNVVPTQLQKDPYKVYASKYNTVAEVIKAFFTANPETEEGHLRDFKEIEFLGFKYEYHPKHNTMYGKLAYQYMLLPIIARWACSRYGYDSLKESKEVQGLPREYKGGTAEGFMFEAINDKITPSEDYSPSTSYSAQSADKELTIPLVKRNTAARSIAICKVPPMVYKELDDFIERLEKKNIKVQLNDDTSKEKTIAKCVAPNETYYVIAKYKSDIFKAADGTVCPAMLMSDNITLYRLTGADTLKQAQDMYYLD